MTLPPLYDVENALTELARARRRRDELTTETTRIADRLAASISRHFGPEALETAGLAMVIAAASACALALGDDQAIVTCNVMMFAGQRLVLDARAAELQAVEELSDRLGGGTEWTPSDDEEVVNGD